MAVTATRLSRNMPNHISGVKADFSDSVLCQGNVEALSFTKNGTTVGGTAYSAVSATDNLLASAGASGYADFAQTYSIPASTLGVGTVVKVKVLISIDQADGADTFESKITIGSTVLMTATAFDPSAVTDFVQMDFTLVSRAAASAASSCVGTGFWTTSDTGTEIRDNAILAPTNLATNGALILKVSGKWSSTTALTNANLTLFVVEIS